MVWVGEGAWGGRHWVGIPRGAEVGRSRGGLFCGRAWIGRPGNFATQPWSEIAALVWTKPTGEEPQRVPCRCARSGTASARVTAWRKPTTTMRSEHMSPVRAGPPTRKNAAPDGEGRGRAPPPSSGGHEWRPQRRLKRIRLAARRRSSGGGGAELGRPVGAGCKHCALGGMLF